MVLFGGGGTERCAHPATAMTWARPAAGAWAAAPWDPLLCANPYTAEIVSNGRGLVLAGSGFGEVPLVWTSSDGLTWVEATPRAMHDSLPRGAAWSGSEYVVLSIDDPGTDEWTSADGRTWSRTPRALPVTAYAASIAPTGDSLIAVVGGDDDQTTTWQRAVDGSWAPIAIPGVDPAIRLRTVVSISGRLVFLAIRAARPVLVTWRPGDPGAAIIAPPVEAIDVLGVAVKDEAVVLLGGVGTLDERHPAVWSTPASVLSGS
jgi:hypothetical protein